MPTPIEIVVDSIADGYSSLLQRLCECARLRREYSSDLELASVADAVMRALSEESSISVGPVKVEMRRKLLGKSMKVELWGKEVSPDELLAKISQARSRAAWLQSDCSDQAVMEPVYASNDREAIEFAMRNLAELAKICDGATPNLDLSNLPEYVVAGIKRGLEKYINKK